MSCEILSFHCEWFDTQASLVRLYLISFYPQDQTVEMVDLKNKKVFLRRQQVDKVTQNSFYLGAVINVCSRQLKITDYADNKTMNQFENHVGKTLAIIKPCSYLEMGKIIDLIMKNNFNIVNLKLVKLSIEQAKEFYEEHKNKSFFIPLCEYMSSDLICAIELVSGDVLAKWRQFIGPTDSQIARQQAPSSLRALFGQDAQRNAVHGSDSVGSARRECAFFFSEHSQVQCCPLFNNSTCCIIKPHILRENRAGEVIHHILQKGFEISAMQMIYLDKPTAIEFYEVYKDVLPEYSALCDNLSKGACLVLEVRQQNAVQQFREACGPHDPAIATALRPGTIRATFGIDRVQNAVHCTDLEEDGVLECEYFFSILQHS